MVIYRSLFRRNLITWLVPTIVALFHAPQTVAAEIIVGPPFLIQDAVNLALANGDAGDVIFVNPGVYSETVTIDFGATNQKALTITRSTNKRPEVLGGFRIDDSRLVTLFGLKVFSPNGDGVAAIDVRDSTGVAVIDCVAGSGDDGGLDCDDTYEVIVDECTFSGMQKHGNSDMGFGVRIQDRSCHQVYDTVAEDNQGDGFFIDSDRVDMKRCTARDNGQAGIYVRGVLNSVRDCVLNENDGVGLNVVGVCDVKKSDMKNNGKQGVKVGEDGTVQYFGGVLTKNDIVGNEGVGVMLKTDQDGVDVRDNLISGNDGAGVRAEGDRYLIRDNTIKNTKGGSSGHGVFITSGSDGSCILENVFKDNDGAAVQVDGDYNYVLLNKSKDGDAYTLGGGTTGNDGRTNVTSGGNDFP